MSVTPSLSNIELSIGGIRGEDVEGTRLVLSEDDFVSTARDKDGSVDVRGVGSIGLVLKTFVILSNYGEGVVNWIEGD